MDPRKVAGDADNNNFIDEQRSRQHVSHCKTRLCRYFFLLGDTYHLTHTHTHTTLPPHQQVMLREQDQGLEELGTAVDRVGRMADAMNQELNAQNRMLGELEVEVENTNEQMNFVMGKLSKLLKTKGKRRRKRRQRVS